MCAGGVEDSPVDAEDGTPKLPTVLRADQQDYKAAMQRKAKKAKEAEEDKDTKGEKARGRGRGRGQGRGADGKAGGQGKRSRAMKRPAAATASTKPPVLELTGEPGLVASSGEQSDAEIELLEPATDKRGQMTAKVKAQKPRKVAKVEVVAGAAAGAAAEVDTRAPAAKDGGRGPRKTFAGRRPPKTASANARYSALLKVYHASVAPKLLPGVQNSKVEAGD